MTPRQPEPTKCPYCGTLAAEWVCHICKRVKAHAGDHAVGVSASIVGVLFIALIAGGLA